MREFIDVTGKTEEEAIQKALRQLGLDRDDVSVEILERAKSGFLGLGSCPAKVRVSYGPRREEPARSPLRRPSRKPPASRRRSPAQSGKGGGTRAAVEETPGGEAPGAPLPLPVALGEEVDDEKAQAIRTFLSGLLAQMESNAEVQVYLPEKGRYKVILEGKNLGALIGRRGETLDAIQQLTSYAVNRTAAAGSGSSWMRRTTGKSGSRACSTWPGRWPPRSPVPPQRDPGAHERL